MVAAWSRRLSGLNPGAVVVVGVAGGLSPQLRAGDVVVAAEVRDRSGSVALPAGAPLVAELRARGLRVHAGPVLSTDHLVNGPERVELSGTGAIAVDMESAAILRALADRQVPVVVVRVIVDTVHAPLNRLSTITSGARALHTLRRFGPALNSWGALVGPRTLVLADSGPADSGPADLGAADLGAAPAIGAEPDVVLVLGSRNRPDSRRLLERYQSAGTPAHLVEDPAGILPRWLTGTRTVAIAAAASAPAHLVHEVIQTLRALGGIELIEREVSPADIRPGMPRKVAN